MEIMLLILGPISNGHLIYYNSQREALEGPYDEINKYHKFSQYFVFPTSKCHALKI